VIAVPVSVVEEVVIVVVVVVVTVVAAADISLMSWNRWGRDELRQGSFVYSDNMTGTRILAAVT